MPVPPLRPRLPTPTSPCPALRQIRPALFIRTLPRGPCDGSHPGQVAAPGTSLLSGMDGFRHGGGVGATPEPQCQCGQRHADAIDERERLADGHPVAEHLVGNQPDRRRASNRGDDIERQHPGRPTSGRACGPGRHDLQRGGRAGEREAPAERQRTEQRHGQARDRCRWSQTGTAETAPSRPRGRRGASHRDNRVSSAHQRSSRRCTRLPATAAGRSARASVRFPAT